MDKYGKNDRINGDRILNEAEPLWEKAMENCPESNLLFSQIRLHEAQFYSQDDWESQIAEVILEKGSVIDRMTYEESSQYSIGKYHKSGVTAGNIEKIFIGAPDAPLCKPPERD